MVQSVISVQKKRKAWEESEGRQGFQHMVSHLRICQGITKHGTLEQILKRGGRGQPADG